MFCEVLFADSSLISSLMGLAGLFALFASSVVIKKADFGSYSITRRPFTGCATASPRCLTYVLPGAYIKGGAVKTLILSLVKSLLNL